MRDCIIIGNGPSRLKYDLNSITIPTFGCNFVYREHRVDHLVAQDRTVLATMEQEAIDQPVWVPEMRYRQGPVWKFMQSLRSPYFMHRSLLSGEWCIVLAAEMGYDTVHLVGFDGGAESLHRGLTRNNASLVQCQPRAERYHRVFKDLLTAYPKIKIITDPWFLSAYADK